MEDYLVNDTCFDEQEMGSIVKNIYASCDPDETNSVSSLKLINFIKPYMMEDLNALENLKLALDPQNMNINVSSERFFEVMREWTKKVANSSDEDSEFNRTPSQINSLEEKDLPYQQSTPRASFGEKLLKCKDLLNLSNVSSYSLSTSRIESTVDIDKTVFEEEIKKLQHQLSKVTNEMVMARLQLTALEELNETLQTDIERLNRRLHSEQQVIEHLQKDKKYNDELREEVNYYKKQMEELKKKMSQSEKDSQYFQVIAKKAEEEKAELEKKCDTLSKNQQDYKKEIFEIRTDLDIKEQEIADLLKINDHLNEQLKEHKDQVDQLKDEADLLSHQKNTLEKALKGNKSYYVGPVNSNSTSFGTYSSAGSLPSNPSSPNLIIPFPDIVSPLANSPFRYPPLTNASSPLLKNVLLRNSTPKAQKTILDESLPDISKSLPVLSLSTGGQNNLNNVSHSPPIMYCVERTHAGTSEQQTPSDEELYWKFQGAAANIHESLQAEICKANETHMSPVFVFNKEPSLEVDPCDGGQMKEDLEHLETKLELAEKKNKELSIEFEKMCQYSSGLIKQIEKLTVEIGEKEMILENVTKTNSGPNDIIIQMEKKNRELEVETIKLRDENNNLLEDNLVLTSSLECKNACIETLEKRVSDAESEKNELHSQIEFLEEEVVIFKTEINNLKSKNQELSDKLASLVSSQEILHKELKEKDSEIMELKNKVSEMFTENNNLKMKNADFEQELHSLGACTENLGKELSDKETESQRFETLLSEINTENENLKACNKELADELHSKHFALHSISKQFIEKEVEGDKLVVELSNTSATLDELQNSNKKLAAVIADKESQLAMLHEDLKKHEANEEKLAEQLRESRAELDSRIIETNKFASLNDNIHETTSKIQEHIGNRENIIIELTELNKHLETKTDSLIEGLKEKIRQIDELRNEIKSDISIKNNLWKHIQNLKAEVDNLKRLNEELSENEQDLYDEIEEVRNEHGIVLNLYDAEMIKNSKLNEQISMLKEEHENLLFKYNDEVTKNEDASEKYSNLSKKHDSLFQSYNMEKENSTQLAVQLSDLENKFQELLCKNERNIKTNGELTTEISILQKKCEDLVYIQDANENQIENLTKTISSIQSENEEYILRYKEQVEKNEELTSKIFLQNEEYCNLLSRFSKETDINMELNKNFCEQEEKYKELSLKVLDGMKEKNRLNAENERFRRENEKLALDIRKTEARCNSLETSLQKTTQELQRIESQNQILTHDLKKERTKTLDASDALSVSSVGTEKSFVEPKRKSFAKQQMTIDKLKEKTEYLERQLNFEKCLKESLLKSNDGLSKDKCVLEQKWSDALKNNTILKTKVEELLEENNKLELRLENYVEDISTAKSKIKDVEIKLQTSLEEVTSKDTQIKYLKIDILSKDNKIVENESRLSDKDEKIHSLERENMRLQEMLSKSDDHKEKELLDLEHKISVARESLRTSTLEMEIITNNLSDAKKEFFAISQGRDSVMRVVLDGRKELKRTTLTLFEWLKLFETEHDENLEKLFCEQESLIITSCPTFQDELHLLSSQMSLTTSLLDYLVSTLPSSMNEFHSRDSQKNIRSEMYISKEGKALNKFTLRAPNLSLSRPASPDSPSVDVIINEGDLIASETTRDPSPHDGIGIILNTYDGLQPVAVDEPFQLTYTSLSDEFLETLGLHENSPKKNLSKEEISDQFTALAVRISMDGKEIRERLESHKKDYSKKEEKYLTLLQNIRERLRDHVCIGTNEPINPVFVLLEELRMMSKDLTQCAGQFGVLSYDLRFKKCWNLIVNYTAMLRQENEALNSPTSSTPSQTQQSSALRRRLKKTDKDCDNILTKETSANIENKSRFSKPQITVTTIVLLVFVIFIGCVIIHWHCRATAHHTQTCPLDGFVSRRYFGLPPV